MELAMNTSEMLAELCKMYGPPGRESQVREKIKEFVSPYCDEISVDNSGNLTALKKGAGKKSIMISTHMDEVSLLVTKILEDGFLRVEGIGVDPKILPSQKVLIHTRSGELLRGVVGMLAPHLQTEETRKKVTDFDSLFVDATMGNFNKISVGDFVTFDIEGFQNGNYFFNKTVDNRSSCVASILVLKTLEKFSHDFDVHAVFSSREEIGAFGARTAANLIKPDIALIIDVAHGNEIVPGLEKADIGKGPILSFGPVINKDIFEKLSTTAEKHGISFQLEPAPSRTGTDADQIQLEGIQCAVISIPLRYMHNPYEMIDIKDVEETARLLAMFILELEGGEK